MRLIINGFCVDGTVEDFKKILSNPSEAISKERWLDAFSPRIMDCSKVVVTSQVKGTATKEQTVD